MKQDLFIVTGASSGIGEAIARRIFHTSASILLTGRNQDRLRRLSQELSGAHVFAADLKEISEIDRLAQVAHELCEKHSLKLRGLINNAGIFLRESFDQTSEKNWQEIFQVNLFSPVELTKKLHPLLKRSENSSVLNIASTLGLRPVPKTSAYSSAKAALINWTKTLALEWATDDIRVNCLCPGLVDTPIHLFHAQPDSLEARRQAHLAQPLQRMGRPEDIAEAAWFLLSKESSWTTGAAWTVDGGIHLL